MDDEIRAAFAEVWRAIEHVRDWIRRVTESQEVDHKTNGRIRDRQYAEWDALIAEVELLRTDVRRMERSMMPHAPDSQNERIRRAVDAATAAFTDVLFEMLPPDRAALKSRFQAALGNLFAEVIGGATVMAANAVAGVALDPAARM